MEQKRARTNATTVNDHEECDEQSSVDMDIVDYRRDTVHIQKRHSVAFGSHEDVPTPQKGQTAPLEHSRPMEHSRRGRKKRVGEWVLKALPLAKPGVWGCVQTRV